MIQIDFLQEISVTNLETGKAEPMFFPRTYHANDFSVLPLEWKDNEGNEELSEFNRKKVTRITFCINAECDIHGVICNVPIKEYPTLPDAFLDYDDVIKAVERGDKLYSFRR